MIIDKKNINYTLRTIDKKSTFDYGFTSIKSFIKNLSKNSTKQIVDRNGLSHVEAKMFCF